MFLMVEKKWRIKTSLNAFGASIQSGRATNSPASPEAGPSDKDGVTRWRYKDAGLKEGDISVTCKLDDEDVAFI